LLAFFGISAFAILAAAAGIYAFRQVGDRLELIDARVPQVVSSMAISRAADRLIASTPALLAAATTKERDEISSRMRPEVDRLIIGLTDIGRAGSAGESTVAIQSLVASLRSNLAELEPLVGRRRRTAAGSISGQPGDAAAVRAVIPGHSRVIASRPRNGSSSIMIFGLSIRTSSPAACSAAQSLPAAPNVPICRSEVPYGLLVPEIDTDV
jgi:hypothetical protein